MIQEEEKASERGYCHTVQQAAFDVMRTTRAWLDKEIFSRGDHVSL